MELNNQVDTQHAFPCAPLYRYVDRIWAWEGQSVEGLQRSRMLPGTGKELTFHYGAPFGLEYDNGKVERLPQAHLICLRSKSALLQLQPDTKFISIRFRTGAFRYFCQTPAADLADIFVDAEDLFGLRIRSLTQRLVESETFQQRFDILQSFMLMQLQHGPALDKSIDHAVDRFYYEHSFIRPASLCDSLGIGLRQFQRRFKGAMGVDPKRFICLSRFQHTVKSLLLTGTDDMLGTALEHGFYDQSHFIRHFKSLVGLTPHAFLEEQKGMTHFYNTSRPKKIIV